MEEQNGKENTINHHFFQLYIRVCVCVCVCVGMCVLDHNVECISYCRSQVKTNENQCSNSMNVCVCSV